MELKHIDIAKLSVSPVNMRGVKKAPDLTNIFPSVRARRAGAADRSSEREPRHL